MVCELSCERSSTKKKQCSNNPVALHGRPRDERKIELFSTIANEDSDNSALDFNPSLPIFCAMLTRVAVAILRRNGKLLVCQRKKGGRYELKWEFPGGKLELNETIIQSLQRELR